MKICLKELRESLTNLKIQKGAALVRNIDELNKLIKENDELISIFVSSVKTASSKK
jgi:hypothetical protein